MCMHVCVYTHLFHCRGVLYIITVRVENFEVFLISRFSWVADDTRKLYTWKVELLPAKFSK